MNKAVFLDRDGTLISHRLQGISPRKVRLIAGAVDALKLLKDAGFKLVVITNQPSVARGLITAKELEDIHAGLGKRFKKGEAELDAVYACPHEHADNCNCRKPKLALVRKAIKRFDIGIQKSFFVGDGTRDVETGKRAKMKTILVLTGEGGRDKRFYDPRPDYTAKNILEAARIIVKDGKKN